MAEIQRHLSEYLDSLPEETEESRFLQAVPWVLDTGAQNPAELLRTLRREAGQLSDLPHQVFFTLITPLYNTPARLLRELILSVRLQSWPHWELLLVDDGSPDKGHLGVAREWSDRDSRIKLFACEENRGISGARNFAIEQSSGEFFCILDHDDLLHPTALGLYARAINADPGVNFVFSNECQITDDTSRTYGYFSKPLFDLFTLLRANYVCHFTAIRRDLLMASRRDGRVFRPEYDGAEDHDLFARVALTGLMKSAHIPLFLYYWRAVPTSCSMSLDAKPEIPERRLCLLDELVPQAYPGGTFRISNPVPQKGECHLTIQIRSLEGHERPSLLVLIPFRDQTHSTLRAVEALEKQRHELDVEVVLIDNRSIEPGTLPTLREWIEGPRRNRYRIESHDGPFHPSRIANRAFAKAGDGKELLLLLHNDVELKTPNALQTLAMQLLADPKCGFVGMKLLGPDGREVRHAGYKVGEAIDGSGYNRIEPILQPREFLHDEHVTLAVSFACAMTRAETYRSLGGLDEAQFSDDYGDIDLCARAVAAGYRNYYFGTLAAVHHEKRGRGLSGREAEFMAIHERHAQTLATWRVRLFCHSVDPIWPAPRPVAPPPVVIEVPVPYPVEVLVPVEVPAPLAMRHLVVDRINSGLKRMLGPAHGLLKSGLMGSVRITRKLRAAKAPGRSIYRPQFLRKARAKA